MKRPVIISLLILALVLVCAGIGGDIFYREQRLRRQQPVRQAEYLLPAGGKQDSQSGHNKTNHFESGDDSGNVTITGADVETCRSRSSRLPMTSPRPVQTRKSKTSNTPSNKRQRHYSQIRTAQVDEFQQQGEYCGFHRHCSQSDAVDVNTNIGEVSVTNQKEVSSFKIVLVKSVWIKLKEQFPSPPTSGGVTATVHRGGTENIELSSDFGTITPQKCQWQEYDTQFEQRQESLSSEVNATGDIYTDRFGDTDFENGSANSLSMKTKSGGNELDEGERQETSRSRMISVRSNSSRQAPPPTICTPTAEPSRWTAQKAN